MRLINILVLSLVVILALGSCEKKVVDLQPIDQIPSERAIQSVQDLTQAVNGVYATWQPRRPIYISALISDETRLGTGTEYRNVGNILFNWNHTSDSQDWRDDETGGVFTNMYAVIDRANRVLFYSGNVRTTTAAEAALVQQFRGEMLALRAFAHLELLRNFSATPDYQPDRPGVVLMTQYATAPGSFRPSRNTQGEVMTQIMKDLADARPLIPATFSNISRITQNGVSAMMVRAAQWSKNWQLVVDRATEVIAAQPLSTGATYSSIWTSRSLTENQSTEVIWKINIGPADVTSTVVKPIGSLWQDVGTGAVQASPSQKLLNTFDPVADQRYAIFFRSVGGRVLIAKYGVAITGNGENFQYDVKMLRTSEVLLARAEAYAELNQLPNANNDLKALRAARITGYVHTDINDKAALISAILTERYKELSFEGHRYYDLKRRVLPIVRDLADVGGNASIQTLQPTDSRYLLPIPQQEITANPNFGQNPGY